MKRKKQEERTWFLVMNDDLEYFGGLHNGGELKWSHNYDDAKPLCQPEQFAMLQKICKGQTLLLDLIK
jgi:hypothetical protein